MYQPIDKFIASTDLLDLISPDEEGQEYLVIHTQSPLFIGALTIDDELEIVVGGPVSEVLQKEALAWIIEYKKSVEITKILNKENNW